jgi:hypothetical protein
MARFDSQPWRTVQGIEFRSVTVEAFKGRQGPCFERNQAVIYKGPFKEVLDDDNHHIERGKRYAVCDKTYELFSKAPYRDFFEFVDPRTEVPIKEAEPFDCSRPTLRHPRETKGADYNAVTLQASAAIQVAAGEAAESRIAFSTALRRHTLAPPGTRATSYAVAGAGVPRPPISGLEGLGSTSPSGVAAWAPVGGVTSGGGGGGVNLPVRTISSTWYLPAFRIRAGSWR